MWKILTTITWLKEVFKKYLKRENGFIKLSSHGYSGCIC